MGEGLKLYEVKSIGANGWVARVAAGSQVDALVAANKCFPTKDSDMVIITHLSNFLLPTTWREGA